jgi:hypothetical protein
MLRRTRRVPATYAGRLAVTPTLSPAIPMIHFRKCFVGTLVAALSLAASVAGQDAPDCAKARASDSAWVNVPGFGLVTRARMPLAPDSGSHSDHPLIADLWRFPDIVSDSAHRSAISVALAPGDFGPPPATGCKAKAAGKTWFISTQLPQTGADSLTFAVARYNRDFSVIVFLTPAGTWDAPTLLTFLDHLKVDARIK